jgi:hypothetical protein
MSGNNSKNFFNFSLFINGLLHFFILFVILNFLFMIIITKISKEAIYNEITKNLKIPINILLNKLTNDQKVIIASLPYDDLKRKYKKVHDVVKYNNDSLKYFSTVIIIILFIIVIILSLIYNIYDDKQNIHFSHILKENTITFIFVGFIEIIFFLVIAVNFIPSLPSHIIESSKKILSNIIEEYIKKNKGIKSSINIEELLKAQQQLSNIMTNPEFILNNNTKIETLKNVIIEKFL